MTLEILRNQYTFLQRNSKIYAIFDDKTILCFEYQESVVEKVANEAVPSNWPEHQPPVRGAGSRRVTFAGDVSLHTPSFSDTNDIYL